MPWNALIVVGDELSEIFMLRRFAQVNLLPLQPSEPAYGSGTRHFEALDWIISTCTCVVSVKSFLCPCNLQSTWPGSLGSASLGQRYWGKVREVKLISEPPVKAPNEPNLTIHCCKYAETLPFREFFGRNEDESTSKAYEVIRGAH